MLRRASVDVHTDISCVIHGKVALVTYPSFDLIECPFPLGAAWLGTDARVIARNHTASAILAERDGLVLAQGRLAATRAHEAFELNRLVSAACASDSGRENVGGVTRVTRSSRRRPVTLLVSPVRWPAPREDADIPAAIVFMNDPERKPVTWRDLLRRLYGLTRSEADVALLVLRGGRVGDIARERATSRSTVRTHLNRILSKVGVQSQVELMRKLLGGAAMFVAVLLLGCSMVLSNLDDDVTPGDTPSSAVDAPLRANDRF